MRAILAVVPFLLAGGISARAGLLGHRFPSPEQEVITVTDVAPGALPLRAPTLAEPIYYQPVCVGYRDFGGWIGRDKLPKKEDMIRIIAKVLAKQGYLPADAQHPATQVILFAWGTLYPNIFDFGNCVQLNYRQELAFLGGAKLGIREARSGPIFPEFEGLTFWTPHQKALRSAASDQFYVAKISAYDPQLTAARKPRLLWSTRISGFARGRDMKDALPTIVVIGGLNIGRDTPSPVWTRAGDRFKAEVILGQPKLEEFLDSGRLPVVDVSAGRTKRSK